MADITNNRPPLVFKVKRQTPELIPPAKPTPYEFKELSAFDKKPLLRELTPTIHFYSATELVKGHVRDPAKVIKEAVAKALVLYYPLAGRLREKQGRNLVMECTGEGIVFVEADVEVTLEEFEEILLPPFPCMEELFYDVPGSYGVFDSPLIVIQVTRLRCGGFILGLRMNHVMMDALGLIQFLNAVAELAQGAEVPLVKPVWERQLLRARDPPQVTCVHQDYDVMQRSNRIVFPFNEIVRKYFFFGHKEIAALRRLVPRHLKSSSEFDIITASVWRCRAIALELDPEDEVRLVFLVNARFTANANLPKGYYGNALAPAIATSTASKLSTNPFEYAFQLVKKAKADVTAEYVKSSLDIIASRGEAPAPPLGQVFKVSDVTSVGFSGLDFGWGLPTYSGPAAEMGGIPGVGCFYLAYRKSNGESGTVVPLCLPPLVMHKFVKELNALLSANVPYSSPRSSL